MQLYNTMQTVKGGRQFLLRQLCVSHMHHVGERNSLWIDDRTEKSHEDYSLDNVILALLWEIETQKSPAVETLACMHTSTLPSHSHTGIKVQ